MSMVPRTSPTTNTASRRRLGNRIAIVVATAALVAACGSHGSPTVASVPPSTTTAGSWSGHSPRQSALAFVSCVRAHGVANFPDAAVPVIGGHVVLQIPSGSTKREFLGSAFNACARYLSGGASRPVASHRDVEEALRFAQCLRSHGVTNFPDPNSQGVFPTGAKREFAGKYASEFQTCGKNFLGK